MDHAAHAGWKAMLLAAGAASLMSVPVAVDTTPELVNPLSVALLLAILTVAVSWSVGHAGRLKATVRGEPASIHHEH